MDTWHTAQEMGHALSNDHAVRYVSGDDPDVFGELRRIKEEGGAVINMMERPQDVHWPSVFEKFGLPYSGCDAFVSMLSTHKPWMKIFAERAGMKTARGVTANTDLPVEWPLNFPVIIKPAAEDASVGILQENICRSHADLKTRFAALQTGHPGPWLIEEYIPGTDATVPLIAENGQAEILPILEIRFDSLPGGMAPILSYEAKWLEEHPTFHGHSETCPAQLPDKFAAEIRSGILELARTLNLTGYARIDFRLDEQRRPWFLELNANPRLSEKNCYFLRAAREAGIEYTEILKRIIAMGRRRKIR